MKDTIEQDLSTPEARDALRLEAVPILLALEVEQQCQSLNVEEMISHDELEDSVRGRLGLELQSSADRLYELINEEMVYWNWRWLTSDSGFVQFYARPQYRAALNVNVMGWRALLQPHQCFPCDVGIWRDEFSVAEHVLPWLDDKDRSDPNQESEAMTDEALIAAILEKHLIYPNDHQDSC